MAKKVILSPALIGGWLSEMYEPVAQAHAVGLSAIVEGRIEGALAIGKDGRAALLMRLEAEMDESAATALLGGLPAAVGAGLEIGWSRDKKIGRLAFGYCYARFATEDAPLVGAENGGNDEA